MRLFRTHTYFPVLWTEEGFVYSPGRAGVQIEPMRAPLDPTDHEAIVLRWSDAWRLEVDARFPNARIRSPIGELKLEYRRGTRFSLSAFGAKIEAFVAHVESRAAGRVAARGWLDEPDILWEPVGKLPEPPSEEIVGDGAFRSAPRPHEDPAIALRGPDAAFDTMLIWLASSPEKPFRQHPRQVRLTETHVYVERRDRSVYRVPSEALRLRVGATDGDAVYVFGRRAELVLTRRAEPCPVRALLDARLRERG